MEFGLATIGYKRYSIFSCINILLKNFSNVPLNFLILILEIEFPKVVHMATTFSKGYLVGLAVKINKAA